MAAPPIVIVNVTQTVAPTPSTLQKTGAIISQGGTTTAAQTLTLLTSSASLASILTGAHAVTSIAQVAGTATVTTTANHGFTNGDVIPIVIAGATPVAYNGKQTCTVTGVNTFTYVVPGGTSTPATGTITYTLYDASELVQMNTTFFAQPGLTSVYVLELGEGTAAEGVTALTTFLANNASPQLIYSYLVPREWDAAASYLTLLGNYTATNKQTYFWTTTTSSNYTSYAGIKCVVALVEAATIGATEFSLAAAFSDTLGWNPSSSQQVPPLSYAFQYGVTPYPTAGNQTLLTTLATAGTNVIGTGATGGISNSILLYGTTSDVNPFNYWYSVDWASINLNQALSNEVINGSNSPPYLYYNQNGINRLQARALQVMRQAVTYGLANGTVIGTQLSAPVFAQNVSNGVYAGQIVVNAEPYSIYTAENPNDYAIGKYGGIQIVYTPLRGFNQIIVNLNVTNFVA